MVLTWEAIGVMLALLGATCGVNLFITRAVIRQELEKFTVQVRPIGECRLLHEVINARLNKLEDGSRASVLLGNVDRSRQNVDQRDDNRRLNVLEDRA